MGHWQTGEEGDTGLGKRDFGAQELQEPLVQEHFYAFSQIITRLRILSSARQHLRIGTPTSKQRDTGEMSTAAEGQAWSGPGSALSPSVLMEIA